MKTTIDVPEEILHRAKVLAAQRRTTLRELFLQGFDVALRELAPDPAEESRKNRLALIAALSRVKLTEPIGKFNREELYDRHKGKWE
jgi:hypothetical protein